MVLCGLEPEILAIIVSGVGNVGKWPPSLLWVKTAMALYPKIFIRACPNCAQFTQIFAISAGI